MGIKLSDYIEDVNNLFTDDELKNILISVGYTLKKDENNEDAD